MKRPPFDAFTELVSETVLLRELTRDDSEQLIEIFTYDGKAAESAEDVVRMLSKIDSDYRNGSSVNWGIVERAGGKIAGICGYYRGFEQETGEIGFVLREGFRRKGFMSAALKLAVAFGKQELGLKRVIAITKSWNQEAIMVLENNQFRQTAELPDNYIELEYTGSSHG